MIFWLIFLSSIFLLLGIYSTVKKKQKIYIFAVIVFIVIYFSAFRDGLGMDYKGYVEHCKTIRLIPSDNYFFSEPLSIYFTNYIYKSQFSYVLFFLITSVIINYLCLYVYSKTTNFSIATFFYICYAGLYILSFNVVRQFVAASLFLFASYLWYTGIQERQKLLKQIFALLIVCTSFLIHKSSIILIPILIFSRGLIKPQIACLVLVLSYIIPFTKLPIFGQFMNILEFINYDIYEDYDTIIVTKYSLSNIYLNVLCVTIIISLHNKLKRWNNENITKDIISLYKYSNNMILFCMISYNLSANGFAIMYRMAIYFIVFFPILVGILPKLINKKLAYFLILIPPIILLSTKFIGNNSLFLPSKILPIISIFK